MKTFTTTFRILAATALLANPASAARKQAGGVPYLDVEGSCRDAQKFSSQGNDKNLAYKGCMQDEMNAKDSLAKRWSEFKPRDKQSCVEQSRAPSPSYVEVLTCLEMNTDRMLTGGRPAQKLGPTSSPGSASPGAASPK